MKILSAAALRTLEKETVVRQQLPQAALMERAGRMLYNELQKVFGECACKAEILCGFGNNGGDGLVLARLLQQAGHEVTVYLLEHTTYSTENLLNQERLATCGVPIIKINKESKLHFSEKSIVLDALFGYGLSRVLDHSWAPLIRQINATNNRVFAIDIPSGLLADVPTPPDAPLIKANRTYTLATIKLALLLPAYGAFTGDFVVLDIGLDQEILHSLPENKRYSTSADIKKIVKPLEKFSHKGTFGHALVAGGSYGSIGAIVLASRAALKTGCGLVTSYVPRCGYQILQTALPEALVKTDATEEIITNFDLASLQGKALAVGMGMGTADESQQALCKLLKDLQKKEQTPKLLFDADALNILALQQAWLTMLPPYSILTPHPKELQRLIGAWQDDFEKLQKASDWANRYQQIVVIKGANTAIVLPDGKIHFNATGNPGMATAGAGDVLSGIIISLLAQAYSPADAAILGVYLHGLAGDCAAKKIHPKSMTATDIIDHLSDAWQYILPENLV
ncbi:NAD(P)H-hydrate dehydratase [Sphingobacterium oryzagri]|uniref:Bifunctional NAD(P)H-hydrate repair enzyme n=1 Tax=Sphingobacterium oryzagri TaxID=3025669 RepID=A0ABY7WKN6_9SPHI|nr:NAD(P)H-hydrate dehydratase [Sphingobacterium sp. KACC 22765]WDF70162.1 NAD(P)H-hydrate dehydratase [Sphingobacterium sp. KACC 22765]